MHNKNNGSVWQKLDWDKKVEICMQGIYHEDSLLITFVLIFIALEAMFFAVVFNMKSCFWLNITLAITGILVAIYFMYILKKREDYVDHWGTILYHLWQETSRTGENESGVSASELVRQYEGCMERNKRRWPSIIFGWGWRGFCSGNEKNKKGKFGWLNVIRKRKRWLQPLWSPRWLLVTLMPFLVILGWVVIMVD